MGFNYRQKRKEFEQNWAKALKQYIAAGLKCKFNFRQILKTGI